MSVIALIAGALLWILALTVLPIAAFYEGR